MRMVDIEDFFVDQMGTIDASVVSLLHGWGYEDSERLDDGLLWSIHDSLRRISLEAVSTYPEARGALVLGLATLIVTFALPADDAERAIIETAESYLGETAEGEPLGALEALFGRALALWSAEQ